MPGMRRRATVVGMATLAVTMLAPASAALAAPGDACDNRSNNTYQKLLECMTVDGVREHQAEFQKIADNNPDPVYGTTRAAGTPGYPASVDYVAGLLEEAGYEVTLDPVDITFNFPAVLRQLTPIEAEYETGVFTGSGEGAVTGNVIPVDIDLTPAGVHEWLRRRVHRGRRWRTHRGRPDRPRRLRRPPGRQRSR